MFFSDFSGVLNSKDSGKCSFTDFKQEQFTRNRFELYYKDYDSLRHDVFNKDKTGNTSVIKDAIILDWSNSVYASNYDRSHRFALLCKWNELDNRNDLEMFDITELSIDLERKKEFLENYYGFLISEKTANEVFKTYTDNSFMSWQIYCPFFKAGSGSTVGLIIKITEENKNIINIFQNAKNCVSINDLLSSY